MRKADDSIVEYGRVNCPRHDIDVCFCGHKGRMKPYVYEDGEYLEIHKKDKAFIKNYFELTPLPNLGYKPKIDYTKFKDFEYKQYLPEIGEDNTEEFVKKVEEAMGFIKTNYPYANADFAKFRLPRMKKVSMAYYFVSKDDINDEIIEAFDEEGEFCNLSGFYDCDNNTIAIDKFDQLDTYIHELLHMSSSKVDYSYLIKDEERYIDAAGFSDTNNNGNGLNEGMTELLTEDAYESSGAYYFERRMCRLLYAIAPNEEELTKAFFENNLHGLDFLGDRQDVIKFIKNMDFMAEYDDSIREQFSSQLDVKVEKLADELLEEDPKLTFDDVHSDEMIEIFEEEAVVDLEKDFDFVFGKADFLANIEQVLVDRLPYRLELCENQEEQDDIISTFLNYLYIPEDIKNNKHISGSYSLNERFVDMDALQNVEDSFIEICEQFGYEEDEIRLWKKEIDEEKKRICEEEIKSEDEILSEEDFIELD
ncbi:MAG: hypothetical protein MJ232_01960 [archaeon]|nr:hypothetical protein [archaeon]